MRAGTFRPQSSILVGGAIRQDVGIVGMVVWAVASPAAPCGFAMKILYHDPQRLGTDEERILASTGWSSMNCWPNRISCRSTPD
jgi:hypothetical protein